MSERLLKDLFEDLKLRLREEFALLIAGDLQALAQSSGPKAALVSQIEGQLQSITDPAAKREAEIELASIARIAKENEGHFRAMRNGISSLISRIESYKGATKIGAYGQKGETLAFQRGQGGYAKKV